MQNLFFDFARFAKLRIYLHPNAKPYRAERKGSIHLHTHGRFNQPMNDVFKGFHLIRDPRDLIVSGCFYHQRANEAWLRKPSSRFGGKSYQEKLNSLQHIDDKIMFEMENCASWNIKDMLDWNYQDDRYINAKYEELLKDEDLKLFDNVFKHLSFEPNLRSFFHAAVMKNSLFNPEMKRSKHIRSGKERQFVKYFKDVHHARFEELFGNALERMGYI